MLRVNKSFALFNANEKFVSIGTKAFSNHRTVLNYIIAEVMITSITCMLYPKFPGMLFLPGGRPNLCCKLMKLHSIIIYLS